MKGLACCFFAEVPGVEHAFVFTINNVYNLSILIKAQYLHLRFVIVGVIFHLEVDALVHVKFHADVSYIPFSSPWSGADVISFAGFVSLSDLDPVIPRAASPPYVPHCHLHISINR